MGLAIVDIKDPTKPTRKGNYITGGYARDIAVVGNYAYLANDAYGLVIIDITNPAIPTLKSRYDTAGRSWGVAVEKNYAYVADGENGLVIIDITNPSLPILKGTYNTPGNAENIAVKDNYAYVADGENGLVILDISNPESPTFEGSYDTSGYAYGIIAIGDYVYIADGKNGLVILNISTPAVPVLEGSYDTYSAQNIAISSNYAYIADDSNGLVIVDITNPRSPEFAGSYNTAGYGYGVAVSGNYVYIADFGNGLVILHVENESNVPDTIPPASVTDLKATNTDFNWIRWTWSNPLDADFSHVMIYIDGLFVTNTSEGYYNLTGLTENSTHTISTKTVDTSGNINPSWVNDSATATIITTDTIPPASVTNLDAIDSDSTWIYWTWDNPIDEDFSYVMIYLDGAFVTNTTNSSINYYNATGLSEGSNYTLGIRTVDSSGNINSTFVNDSAVALKLPKLWNISGRDITKDSITLVWEASNDTTEVQIIRDDVVLGNVDGSTSYADSGLSSGRTYTYTLIPYNNNSVAGKAVTVDLTTRSSSGGGGSSRSSSSGGGGGGSASVEDFANLAMKDTASKYLRMDTNVTYLFTREGNPVESISFYSLKNAGQITATVEVLNDMSKLVNSTPEGLLYKYVNIWVGKAGFATADNIKDAYIRFKVNTSWMEQMEINPEDVSLQRYNGTSWEVLPTVMENSTDNYIIFKSQTPGFSPFAITAEKVLAGSSASSISDKNVNVVSDDLYNNKVAVDDNKQFNVPEKNRMWILIAAILLIGLFTTAYVYLNRKHN
jgi:PGF-pre-PGF domain-containing protein